MKGIRRLFFVSTVSLADVLLTTVFYCNGYEFHQTFSLAFSGYSFTSSVFELWILSILRFSLISGLVFGILNGREIGVSRVKSWKTASVLVAGLIVMFTLVKLLSVSEHPKILGNTWFWCLFTWTLVSSIMLVIQWSILGNISLTKPPVLKINCDGDPTESESLLGNQKAGDTLDKEAGKIEMGVFDDVCIRTILMK